ncbi:hypothetical protein EVAR_4037_1 [Eumeta japonica]|uniref:Uncharacterized protein n=1 Tax=Eumeta variegata TaxID=151549 RepID=A0A4C1T424_EUMVA|nr:hypothetical protein EVAR_4037_1 [Eumeta japonica]
MEAGVRARYPADRRQSGDLLDIVPDTSARRLYIRDLRNPVAIDDPPARRLSNPRRYAWHLGRLPELSEYCHRKLCGYVRSRNGSQRGGRPQKGAVLFQPSPPLLIWSW